MEKNVELSSKILENRIKLIISKFAGCIINMINEKLYGKIYRNINNEEEYLEFRNFTEAQKWGKEYYEFWAVQYNEVMRMTQNVVKDSYVTNSIECYCGYTYRNINNFLRYGIDNEIHTYRELADVLSIVLCSAPRIPQNLVVYRMVDEEFIKMFVKANKKEVPIQEKGFMSTSLLKSIVNENEAFAEENNLLKIFVPKDTVGVYVNAITKRSEEEILLLQGMYLGLLSYPYKDIDTGKNIYECQLITGY